MACNLLEMTLKFLNFVDQNVISILKLNIILEKLDGLKFIKIILGI